jgi:hypothetical protein
VKINELVHSPVNTPEANLTTALELIRQRYKDQDKSAKISTQSLINMVLNTDKTFDYDALVAASEKNPAVKNLIKSYNKDTVELRPDSELGSEETTTIPPEEGDPTQAPVDTVSDMAKRAGKKRDASIF